MRTRIKHLLTILFFFCIAAAWQARAQSGSFADWRGERHMACLSNVAGDASQGMARAETWLAEGGGPAARHCLAVAEARIGDPAAAARSFSDLAEELPAERRSDIGRLWGQAGNAWLLAERPTRALKAFDLAVGELPDEWDLLADRAVARALLDDYAGAVLDLSKAIGLVGPAPELLLYRGTAYSHLEDYGRALADLDAALAKSPLYAEALLERGYVRALSGDAEGAKADFRQVQTLAKGGALAASAGAALKQLEGQP